MPWEKMCKRQPPCIPVLLSYVSNEYACINKILCKTNWFLYMYSDTVCYLKSNSWDVASDILNRGKKLKAVELGVCSSMKLWVNFSQRSRSFPWWSNISSFPGLSCTSAPHVLLVRHCGTCLQLRTALCCGVGPWGWRVCKLLLTDPETQTGFLAGLQAPGRALAVRCPAQTGHDPASMEMGQELQLLLAKAPQPFISSCFSPSLVPHFWWQQWHLGFVY